ncbi:cytochrome c biogenesis protein ResB [Thermodesulfobacteriota bacterium]
MTVILLLSLAATSIIGTVIPQNESPAEYLQAFGEFFYRLFVVFDFMDMYHSWWFQFLILLLTVNIVVCSIDRLSSIWKIIFVKVPPFRISRFRNLSDKKEFTDDRSPDELQKSYVPIVARGFGYSRLEKTDKGFCIFAEKRRWGRLGVYIVHLSIILLLVGSLIGSFFGFEGYVNIPEGQIVNSIRIRNSNKTKELDFAVRCDDFSVTYYKSGLPKEFRSSLTLFEMGKPVYNKDVIMNSPLRYRGINIFQSSYGSIPPDYAEINYVIGESGISYNERVKIGQRFDLPAGLGTFELKNYRNSLSLGGHSLGEAFIGVVAREDQEPIPIILPLRFPNFDKMRKGNVFFAVKGYDERYYTGLQVTKDPGVWVVYSGFIFMIIGCFITFFMSHQQVCVEITESGQKSNVMVAGITEKNKLGMQKKITGIWKKLDASSKITS